MCGLPSVTLKGEKLKEYGVEAVGWYHLLCPVLAQFVVAFESPANKKNREFGGKVCHRDRGGISPTYLGVGDSVLPI